MNNFFPYPQPAPQSFPAQIPQHQSVTRVTGENGAKAFPLAPNSSVLMMDETAPVVWLKTTDSAGYPTLQAYSIAPVKSAESIDISALESRIARLEERMEEPDDGKGHA